MVATVTNTTNRTFRSVEGTIGEVIEYLDAHGVPEENIISFGYSAIVSKLFFCVYKLR
jgi:hypothetical protein